MDRLTLIICGGLGNQLLQYVLAHSIARSQLRELEVDRTLICSNTRRLRGVTPRKCSPLIGPTNIAWHHWLSTRISRRLNKRSRLTLTDRVLLSISSSEELLAIRPSNIMTHGTSPLLFEEPFRNSWYTIHSRLPKINVTGKVGVHIRRGDYLNPESGFMPLPLAYYQHAIRRVFAQMPQLGRRLVVFSDDPKWCQTNLVDPTWDLEIALGTPEEDLAAMTTMQALVISNSSLSAIAAHLGESFGKMQLVICPDQWLINPKIRALGDLRKPSWISLPNHG